MAVEWKPDDVVVHEQAAVSDTAGVSTCPFGIVHALCGAVVVPLAPLASGAPTFVLQVMIHVCSFLALTMCMLTAAAVPTCVHSID